MSRIALVLSAALALSAPALAQQTPRMSYQESSAIKRSLLPPGTQMHDWILDHCRPLCAAGSNDRSNLQLQTPEEAHRKDMDEIAACRAISGGMMTVEQAAQYVADRWPCHSLQ